MMRNYILAFVFNSIILSSAFAAANSDLIAYTQYIHETIEPVLQRGVDPLIKFATKSSTSGTTSYYRTLATVSAALLAIQGVSFLYNHKDEEGSYAEKLKHEVTTAFHKNEKNITTSLAKIALNLLLADLAEKSILSLAVSGLNKLHKHTKWEWLRLAKVALHSLPAICAGAKAVYVAQQTRKQIIETWSEPMDE